MIEDILRKNIEGALTKLAINSIPFKVEHPSEIVYGDYSTNVAMVCAKEQKQNPYDVALSIKAELEKVPIEYIESIEVVKPGFINFKLTPEFFSKTLQDILNDSSYGKNTSLAGRKTIVEYTDPNPFKEFHIGHLMSNTIGEALSRIIEWNGAEVKRACYQGDVGLHVAKAIAHKLKSNVVWETEKNVSNSYVQGSKLYEEDEAFKAFVIEVNKKVYNKTDDAVNDAYTQGRAITLAHFDALYTMLGTQFDYFFFESTTGEFGKALVHENKKIFTESEGAVVYEGEKRDPTLHTRVFINKEGLPTYEAKELGLAKIKYDTYPYDASIVITGNEINEYFRVLLSAMGEIFPKLAEKTKHISHGMLRMPQGKMSSRMGNVITAGDLVEEVKEKILEKIETSHKEVGDKNILAQDVAIGAIKYSILHQSIGKDIIFNFETSLSFDGDSGPYLQYANARAHSLLEKAKIEGVLPDSSGDTIYPVERYIYQFPEIILRAMQELAPQLIATYLIELAGSFNHLYAEHVIVDSKDPSSPKKVAITKAVHTILMNGLSILGIPTPKVM